MVIDDKGARIGITPKGVAVMGEVDDIARPRLAEMRARASRLAEELAAAARGSDLAATSELATLAVSVRTVTAELDAISREIAACRVCLATELARIIDREHEP